MSANILTNRKTKTTHTAARTGRDAFTLIELQEYGLVKLLESAGLAAIICATGFCLTSVWGSQAPWEATGKETSASMKARTSTINRPKIVGTYFEANVPDTLDLAERAWLGVNHFASTTSEKDDCEMYWNVRFEESNPPAMHFQLSPLFACQPKCVEAMAMLRLMSGSQQHLEREAKMIQMLVSHLGEDGLFYVVGSGGRKPWLGPEEMRPFAHINGQLRMMRAMIAWYQYTGDPAWKERIDRMVDGLDRIAVRKEDYAYYPTHGWMEEEYLRSCYVKGKGKGWKDTSEPENEKGGEEGSLFIHQGEIPGPLANWHKLTGNKQALRLAGELVRFLMKPKFWADWEKGEYPGVSGAEHAHWQGHYHGYMYVLRAILEYAVATNDSRLKQFVRDGYEWSRQPWLSRIGFVGDGQGCGCGRVIGLAVKLSEAGIGDYWEDVDLYIRNHGIEMQFAPDDIPYIRKIGKGRPLPSKDPFPFQTGPIDTSVSGEKVIEAAIGAFSNDPSKGNWYGCCSPHGNMGLFYAWDGTMRHEDGVVRVNLLLNRASPWMDIDSYLPYEGKVVLRNKTAKEAYVRIPLYVDEKTVNCSVGTRKAQPEWFDRCIRFRGLQPGDVVTIQFHEEERLERWTVPIHPRGQAWYALKLKGGTAYTFRFKGNTLIEISPPLPGVFQPEWHLYSTRAQKYSANKAPVKKVLRYVTEQRIEW